jgi:hypothetical protein
LDGTFAAAKTAADSLADLLSVAQFPIEKLDECIKDHSVSLKLNIVVGLYVLGSSSSIKAFILENSI